MMILCNLDNRLANNEINDTIHEEHEGNMEVLWTDRAADDKKCRMRNVRGADFGAARHSDDPAATPAPDTAACAR